MMYKGYNGEAIEARLVKDDVGLEFWRKQEFDAGLRTSRVEVCRNGSWDFQGWEDVIGYRLI